MRRLFCLLLMGLLTAQDLPKRESQPPKAITPFQLYYEDIDNITHLNLRGNVLVQYRVNVDGQVIKPEIIDSFNNLLNETIIDKVLAIEFEPALQNGRPVEVQYMLPIMFK